MVSDTSTEFNTCEFNTMFFSMYFSTLYVNIQNCPFYIFVLFHFHFIALLDSMMPTYTCILLGFLRL